MELPGQTLGYACLRLGLELSCLLFLHLGGLCVTRDGTAGSLEGQRVLGSSWDAQDQAEALLGDFGSPLSKPQLYD